MFDLLHSKFNNWVAAVTAVLTFCFIVLPFGVFHGQMSATW